MCVLRFKRKSKEHQIKRFKKPRQRNDIARAGKHPLFGTSLSENKSEGEDHRAQGLTACGYGMVDFAIGESDFVFL
jgi:hypothetical protein